MKMGVFRWRWRWALLVAATTVAAHRELIDPPDPRMDMHAAGGATPNSFTPNASGGVGHERQGGEQAGVRRALLRTQSADDLQNAPLETRRPPTTPPPSTSLDQPAPLAPPDRRTAETTEPNVIPITWAKSLLLVNDFAVVTGTMVMFNWGLAEGHPRDLMLCPTLEAFDQCAVDQCQTLAAQETGHYIFDTTLIGGQPVTGTVAAPLPSSTHADRWALSHDMHGLVACMRRRRWWWVDGKGVDSGQ